jgi:hypothetical protein
MGPTQTAKPHGNDVVLSLDPGMNAFAIPLTEAALTSLGVPPQTRQSIQILMTPVDPGNFQQHVDEIKRQGDAIQQFAKCPFGC